MFPKTRGFRKVAVALAGAPTIFSLALMCIALLSLLATGCRSARPGSGGFGKPHQKGIASWYGPGFQGRKTANGETFDTHKMTAAHKKLPFGTLVHVHNLENGKTTRVRINDRGPFIRGRIIDLSHAAAQEIDLVRTGVAKVEIYLVADASSSRSARPGLAHPYTFTLQVAAFQDPARAGAVADDLRRAYPDVRIESDGVWHRIRLGNFASRKQAEQTRRGLRRRGFDAVVLRRAAENR